MGKFNQGDTIRVDGREMTVGSWPENDHGPFTASYEDARGGTVWGTYYTANTEVDDGTDATRPYAHVEFVAHGDGVKTIAGDISGLTEPENQKPEEQQPVPAADLPYPNEDGTLDSEATLPQQSSFIDGTEKAKEVGLPTPSPSLHPAVNFEDGTPAAAKTEPSGDGDPTAEYTGKEEDRGFSEPVVPDPYDEGYEVDTRDADSPVAEKTEE